MQNSLEDAWTELPCCCPRLSLRPPVAPLLESHAQLERLARLHGAEPDTSKRGRVEEDISRPIRELDEPVPFVGIEPFDLSPNRQAG
jgi:hypothetical protein